MDISKQLESVIASIVENVQNNVTLQISDIVKAQLKAELDKLDYAKIIADVASTQVAVKVADLEFDADAVNAQINRATTALVDTINKKATEDIAQLVDKKINAVDFDGKLSQTLGTVITQKLTNYTFPVNSIPFHSINLEGAVISGDHIVGGIVRQFGSTGIDDKSTGCVITIMDSAVVVENNLVTMDLTIQGNLEVNGEVSKHSQFYKNLSKSISSEVHSDLNDDFFKNYSDIIFDQIKREGLDLDKITVAGSTVIEGNSIGLNITESNLQKLGLLKELQVEGETAIAGTFYVGNKRVGVNTLEPSAALTVWDAEIEITVSKLKENVGMLTTPRTQTLVLGSNRNQNIVLNTDGTTQIDNLQIGSTRFGSSETPPNYTSVKGHTVFNANPSPGGPMGWVCLGGPNWANFGIID
jgi:hypothetical protein